MNQIVGAIVILSTWNSLIRNAVSVNLEQCPAGLPSTTITKVFGSQCYQFVSDERYWTGARDYCIQYGGRLVKIENEDVNDFIISTLNQLWWRNSGVWIGLHDNNVELDWQWIGKSKYENDKANWFNWAHGHPRAFLHMMRDCVRMVRGDGDWLWHETPCVSGGLMSFATFTWQYRFICQYDAKNDTNLSAVHDEQSGINHINNDKQMQSESRRVHTTTVSSTVLETTTTVTSPVTQKEWTYNSAKSLSNDAGNETSYQNFNSGWTIASICIIAMLVALLFAVLLWRRRSNRQLMLVATIDDLQKDLETYKNSKSAEMSFRVNRGSRNIYTAEPCLSSLMKQQYDNDDDTDDKDKAGSVNELTNTETAMMFNNTVNELLIDSPNVRLDVAGHNYHEVDENDDHIYESVN